MRALTNRTDTFRFASSAPFYVEVGPGVRRVSKAAVAFFEAWIDERIARLVASDLAPDKAVSVLGFQREAKRVWDDLAARANAD